MNRAVGSAVGAEPLAKLKKQQEETGHLGASTETT